MTTYLLLGAAIVLEVFATAMLKASDGFTQPGPALATVLGYAASFYCLSLVLRSMPVGVAYAIWSGVGIVITAVVAFVLFGQRLDAPALAGMGLIVAGVLVINVFSATAGH
ncbi:MAG: QacE family quaternary ammonium compound efflux SMR transporter [Variovorax paradoxus]|nr:MAG: QacE family quaternary ammonium compound efflux SMR transporter [Variovorax paradoxus]PZQ02131.1 MAG: QacE family quaternary ammonium compound efflux SMR transporter [Variovorax paradoxus]